MKILFSTLIVILLSSIVALDIHSEDVLGEEASEDVLFRQMQKQYSQKVGKASLMQGRLLEYNESKYGVNSVETLKSLEALAWMSMEQQDFDNAEIFYRQAIKIRKESLPWSEDNIKELGVIYFMLGDSYLYRSHYLRAIATYDESMNFSNDHGHRGDAFSRKGIAGEGLEDYQKAVGFYLEALKEYAAAKVISPENTKLLDRRKLIVYKRLPELYHKLGENQKVKEYQDLIKDIKAQKEKEQRDESNGL